MSPSRKSVPSAVVGVDIGSESIKVAEARFAKDGITITALGIAKTPEGTIENEIIVDPKTLGSAVKALLAESGIKTKKCVSSVSGQSNVVVRVIEVPKMKPEELAETMRWEIERHVPFAAQEVEYDFHPLEKPGDDPDAQEMEVLLAVAQQDLVNSHVETLFSAGLQPMAIDVEPLAASRSLIEASQNGALGEIVAIVNIGANVTDVGIFENGLLTFPSPPIAIAGINFTREISEAFGQTLDQAEITKKEYAAADAAIIDAVAPPPEPAEPEPQPEPQPESTQFNTVFTQPDVQPADADTPAAESPQFGSFTNTVDGPVFDMPDAAAGSVPDTGEAAPAGPVFDLGEASPAASHSEPVGPAFDLGEVGQPAPGPAFDLGDMGGAQDESPVFDIGGGEHAAAEPAAAPDFDFEDIEPDKPAEDAAVFAPALDLDDVAAQPEGQTHQGALPPDASTTEQQVAQAISGVLVELANDLRRSLEYYSTRYSKMPSRVYLCGGTAKMPKLDEFLSRELGIKVVVADPLKNVRVNVPAASPQYLKEISPLLPVSIGLAIRDMIG